MMNARLDNRKARLAVLVGGVHKHQSDMFHTEVSLKRILKTHYAFLTVQLFWDADCFGGNLLLGLFIYVL